MAAGLPDGMDALALVRRYEPVVRYTAGELFLPMSAEAYVREAALWAVDPATGQSATLVVDHGKLDLDRLCGEPTLRRMPSSSCGISRGRSIVDSCVGGDAIRTGRSSGRRRDSLRSVCSADSSTWSSGSHCCCGAGYRGA